jgi:hypothetical protein
MQGFQNQKIGLLGETFVSNASHSFICLAETSCSQQKGQWVAFLSSEKGLGSYPSLDKSNRNHLYPRSPYKGPEKGITDFTYPDTNGDLTKLLVRFGFLRNVQSWSSSPPTYHLEVKLTSESYGVPFYMSNSQLDTVPCLGTPCICRSANIL